MYFFHVFFSCSFSSFFFFFFSSYFHILFVILINKWAVTSWENKHYPYVKTETQIIFACNSKLISVFSFATFIVQIPLPTKSEISSLFLDRGTYTVVFLSTVAVQLGSVCETSSDTANIGSLASWLNIIQFTFNKKAGIWIGGRVNLSIDRRTCFFFKAYRNLIQEKVWRLNQGHLC